MIAVQLLFYHSIFIIYIESAHAIAILEGLFSCFAYIKVGIYKISMD